jgi:hypothetical protein
LLEQNHERLPLNTPQIDWNKAVREMNTTPTLQVVVNPKLRRGSPIHDRAFAELRKLGADYVRYVPWFPYPYDSIAELYPPADGKTSWDFSRIDPYTLDFLEATKGHPVMLNFSTIPPWMFKVDKLVPHPDDRDQPMELPAGHRAARPSLKELAIILCAWLPGTPGRFTDEYGKFHSPVTIRWTIGKC